MGWSGCHMAWGWLEVLLHPEGPERAQSFRKSVQRFQSKKLTAELPEHPDDKLPQRLGKIRRGVKALSNHHHLIVCPQCAEHASHLWLAVLLDPAENAGRKFLKAAHWNGVTEGLEQGVHDVLKDVELHLVRHLVLSLLWVVLMGPHYVLIVPVRRDNHCFLTGITKYIILVSAHIDFTKKRFFRAISSIHQVNQFASLSKCDVASIKILTEYLRFYFRVICSIFWVQIL